MSVTLINGDGNPKILAAQDSDWYATLTEQTTCILKVNGNLEATITDANTIEIDSGVCISKEGRRVQIDSGDIAEIIIPTGTQGVDTYYIIGFHLYIDDEGTQVAETFCQTMESSTATITETTFKEGSSSIYLSLYRVKREGLSLASVSRIVPLMDLPSNYIAEHEEGATASQNYSVGDYFTNAGALKKVIATITSGDSISDSNTSDTTVASELSRINSDLSAIDLTNLPLVDITNLSVGLLGLTQNCCWKANAGTSWLPTTTAGWCGVCVFVSNQWALYVASSYQGGNGTYIGWRTSNTEITWRQLS